ncbi:hypothetical protein CFK37_09135 [Virgibacillus phasianinus]|uniref:DUF4183 domain-containing protein n=1 Tax=Virgibacillus phasianinus TaxID=2017483 RepID=A0A220U2F9_9BACI|nr:DUF4183 domain-containing protein [Virgibacillus phasianinus]ASK62309.1 hypothetical protein CFK37_09135 [Virgibacillus phasianinus]
MKKKYCHPRYTKKSSFDEDLRCKGTCEHCCKECRGSPKNSPVNTNTFNPSFNPSITINVSTGSTPNPSIGLETVQYIALAKEDKKIYTNQDALKQYGSGDILNPNNVSYTNLFVNGVLQPPSIYDLEEAPFT